MELITLLITRESLFEKVTIPRVEVSFLFNDSRIRKVNHKYLIFKKI